MAIRLSRKKKSMAMREKMNSHYLESHASPDEPGYFFIQLVLPVKTSQA